jgi:hypothetical protein
MHSTKCAPQQQNLGRVFLLRGSVLQREVFKHFDEGSRPREDKIIHNKVAKAAKTNHCRSLVETVLSSWPLCPCCEISGYLVAAMPQCVSVLKFCFHSRKLVAGPPYL